MNYLKITKDIGYGDERKVEIDIKLSIEGKTDSFATTRFLGKEVEDVNEVSFENGMLNVHLVAKIPKKSVTSEKGQPLDMSYTPFFIENLLDNKRALSWSKAIGDPSANQLIYADLLFTAICLDACERTCKTTFPWCIGGAGSAAIQDAMINLIYDRKDFNANAHTAKDNVKALSNYGAYAAGSIGAVVGTGAVVTGVAGGTITAAGMATSAGVVAGAATSGAAALAGGAGMAGAASAAGATMAAGAEAAAAFGGVALGAAAAPITLTVASVGLAIMGVKGMIKSVESIVLKQQITVLQRYAELVQRGNIGTYCAKNELQFHEIWTELAEKCEACGASDIFDLESKIAVLL